MACVIPRLSLKRHGLSARLMPAGGASKTHEPDAGRGGGVARENRSDHRMDAVICIATNRVTIAPIVIASPVNPLKKNADEKSTR